MMIKELINRIEDIKESQKKLKELVQDFKELLPIGLMEQLHFVRHTSEFKGKVETDDYLILAEYPEIDYTLLIREAKYEPFVAAWGFNKEGNYWSQGHYFSDILDATAWIQYKLDMKANKISYERMCELATNAMHELDEFDNFFEYFKRDNDMDENELKFFGLAESEDNEDDEN